jgi:hypothetical protein
VSAKKEQKKEEEAKCAAKREANWRKEECSQQKRSVFNACALER